MMEFKQEYVEIRRLIEERRTTPKEEKQRSKDVSKQIRKCIRDKKRAKRQEEIQRILEDFNGIKKIPGIKSAKRRALITKIKNEKGGVITSRKGIANVFGEFYKQFYDDQEHEETEQENEENENESSIDVQNKDLSETMRIPEITTEELQTAINRLKKKADLQTATESELKTSKHATMRRKKW